MKIGLVLSLAAAAVNVSMPAHACPEKSTPVRIVVPFGAGGSTDILARALARGITEVSGQNAFVENKAGAEGVIGMTAAKSATPDGCTLLMTSSSTQVLNPNMIQKLPYDPIADFIPLVGVAKFSFVMNAGPSVYQKSAKEFIASARANPGKYTFGSSSAAMRMAGEMLQHVAGIKMLAVPYKSGPEALTALGGGQVDIVFVDVAGSTSLHRTGRVRPMAVSGTTRAAALPDVPTLQEQGVNGYEVTGWHAAYYPARTPELVVAGMRDILQKAIRTPAVQEVFANFALEPLAVTGNELALMQKRDSDRWGKLIESAKLGKQSLN